MTHQPNGNPIFLEDHELQALQGLHALATARDEEARQLRAGINAIITAIATRHGLTPDRHYYVTPRGQLLPLPTTPPHPPTPTTPTEAPTPYTLHPTPYTPDPTPYTPDPTPERSDNEHR